VRGRRGGLPILELVDTYYFNLVCSLDTEVACKTYSVYSDLGYSSFLLAELLVLRVFNFNSVMLEVRIIIESAVYMADR